MSPAQLSELETLAAKFSVEITQALPYATDEERSSYLSQLRLIEAHSKVADAIALLSQADTSEFM